MGNALPGAAALSEEEIAAFVHDREKKRRQDHDFQGADAIRNHLRAHGVEVWERENLASKRRPQWPDYRCDVGQHLGGLDAQQPLAAVAAGVAISAIALALPQWP